MAKIIMTGNPDYGICKAFVQIREATCVSFSSGMDLTDRKNHQKFAEMSLEYDVFVNNSALCRMNQTFLLKAVHDMWSEKGKSGLMVVLGSTADIGIRGGSRLYPVEKAALRDMCRRLSFNALADTPNAIRVTLLSPGYVATPSTDEKHPTKNKISTEYVAKMIDWVISQPPEYMFNEISFDPLQPGEESRERRIHDPKKQTK